MLLLSVYLLTDPLLTIDFSVLVYKYSSTYGKVLEYLHGSTVVLTKKYCCSVLSDLHVLSRVNSLFLSHCHQVAECGDAFGLHGDTFGAGIVIELQGEASLVVGLHTRVPVERAAIICRVGQSRL